MNYCQENNTSSNLNYSQMFFILLGTLPILFTFPCWVISKYVFEPMKKEYEDKFDEVMNMLYVPKEYYEKYEVKDISGNKQTNLNNLVLDNTPEGNVVMRFNNSTEAFEYWSDGNINYKHLETVARKYVNSFGCGSLYIDRMKLLDEKVSKIKKEIDDNLKKEKESEKRENNKEKKENDKESTDVFANLKNYNTSTKSNEVKKKITKNDLVCDKANKYIRKGRFTDNREWMMPVKEKKIDINNSGGGIMSWLEWKNKSKKE